MFSSILLAYCLISEPRVSIETIVVNDNGKVNSVTKVGNSKSDWTIDGRFIRNSSGKIVGLYGVDLAPRRILR